MIDMLSPLAWSGETAGLPLSLSSYLNIFKLEIWITYQRLLYFSIKKKWPAATINSGGTGEVTHELLFTFWNADIPSSGRKLF